MKKYLFLILFANTLTIGFGQLESPFGYGAMSLGQGNAFAGGQSHHAILYNQAGTAFNKNPSFALDAANLYNSSGLSHFHLTGIYPSSLGVFGMKIQRYGIEEFNYQNYSLSYSRKLFENFSAALAFNFYQFRITNYGSKLIPNIDLGIQTKISSKLSMGFHLRNGLPLEITENTEFPSIITFGIKYQVNDFVDLFTDVEKNIRENESIKFGVSYLIHPVLRIRTGISTFPASYSFGADIILQKISIHIGNSFHQVLGNTSGLSLHYSIPTKAPQSELQSSF